MNSKIGIVTDSASDIPAEVATRFGVEVVPLSIRFGDEELADREELSTAEFWARCAASSELPSTAAPAPGRFEQSYRRLAEHGADHILAVTLSAALSATYQSAELAAKSVAADGITVRVVDSRTISAGLTTLVIAAAEAAAERGGGGEDDLASVAATIESLVPRTRMFGALDTLDNLKKGGRIGGAKALLATALSIKPIVAVRDGVVEQYGKQRTRSKALRFLADRAAEHAGHMDHFAVMHADCSDVDEFVDMVRPYVDGDIVVGELGPVIGTHTGRGTIGVAFQER
jgi:DegV family protein with EDD domain